MKVLKVNFRNFKEVIKETIKSIKKGEVIVCPTDTVYGLICDATSEKAVKRLFKIKKRKISKPIPIFVKNIKMAKELAFIDKNQEKFFKKVWPDKITVVLRRREDYKLPKRIFGKTKTIGLRIPKYKLVNVLLKKSKRPLTGTSANISGKPPSTKIKEVISQFMNQKFQPDSILNAGDLKKSKPSTIVNLTGAEPKILRIGQISKKEILKCYYASLS